LSRCPLADLPDQQVRIRYFGMRQRDLIETGGDKAGQNFSLLVNMDFDNYIKQPPFA